MTTSLPLDSQINRPHTKRDLKALPSPCELQWERDPIEHALDASAWRSLDTAPSRFARESPPLCTELGRRILIAQLEESEWVLRRVEKVSFNRDRGVHRDITIELLVPNGAPEFVDKDGIHYW